MDSWFAGTTERPPGHQSFLFVQAADTHQSSTAIPSFPANVLTAPQLIRYVQTIALPLAFWFRPFCVGLALFWLCYRAYLVLNKPLDELASLLGFDIPLTPNVALAGVKADGAIVHWSLPEKQKQRSSFKYEIHLNGAIVDTLSSHESAVTISGLQPGAFYIVRIALVNSLDYSSKSAPLRFRTKSVNSGDFFHQLSEGHEDEHDTTEPLLRVQPFRGLKDISPAAAELVPAPARDAALGRKRSNTGRRVSPAIITDHIKSESTDSVDGGETVQQLTERLDLLRREIEEAERQAHEEEEEELRLRDELIHERDALRAEVAEKEKASRNLNKEVKTMEGHNKASQREREKAERLLQQKIQERQKLKDDIVRWRRESEEFRLETEKLHQEQAAYIDKAEKHKAGQRQLIGDHTAAIKVLEEEIKETTAEIKKVERSAKSPSPNGEPSLSLVEQLQHDAEEDRQWKIRTYELQSQYAMAAQRLEQSKRFYYSNHAYLENMREKRRQDEAAVAATTGQPNGADRMVPSRQDSQRSRRGNSGGHTLNDSPGSKHFVPVQSAFGHSSTFASGSLFSFPGNSALSDIEVPEEDRERLTGGALMSPGAGEGLLPADLFASDDRPVSVMPLPGLGLPGFSTQLPGLGQPSAQEAVDQGPTSPASIASHPASTFASPQASQQNLHHHLGSPEALIDSDGRSIRSNRSGRAASSSNTGSRFSAMFGIRARPKNSPLDSIYGGVPLNKIHSHSMPRQDQGIPGLDSTTRKRNSSISGSLAPDEISDSQTAAETPATQVRKRPFTLNPFNRDKSNDGWPSSFSAFGRRPTSPRPGSTHSGELPRPSTDGGRWGVDAWPSTDSGSGARASPLSLGQWNSSLNNSRTYLPNHTARRTSAQYGTSGAVGDIIEDDDSDVLNGQAAYLAPIGTKPAKIEAQNDVKLNPNAKDFKYFLSSMRGKNKDGPSSRNSTPIAAGKDSADDDHSPPQSRKSRDALSTTTLESSVVESRRPSNELVLSPTYSNSEAAYSPQIGSGSLGKESFMQKISRKSSSSKFSLPTFKREKSRLDRDVSISSPSIAQAEEDDDAMSASVGSVKERESSEKSRNNTRSWSNVLKIGKKKAGGETPSISELSTASTGDENNDET